MVRVSIHTTLSTLGTLGALAMTTAECGLLAILHLLLGFWVCLGNKDRDGLVPNPFKAKR